MSNPFMANSSSTVSELDIFKEYAWDFDRQTYIYDNTGRHVIVTKNDALKIWIKQALLVERYRYRAYFDDYGAELEHFIGTAPNSSAASRNVFTYIKDALLVNPYIVNVVNISCTQDKKKISLLVEVTTVYGSTTVGIEV